MGRERTDEMKKSEKKKMSSRGGTGAWDILMNKIARDYARDGRRRYMKDQETFPYYRTQQNGMKSSESQHGIVSQSARSVASHVSIRAGHNRRGRYVQ